MFATETDLDNLKDEVEDLGDAMISDPGVIDKDFRFDDPVGQRDHVSRLREGIERFLITDINNPAASAQAQSAIVVMHDSISTESSRFNHVPGGSNILYMDGHVEFSKWNNGTELFPMNQAGLILHAAGEN